MSKDLSVDEYLHCTGRKPTLRTYEMVCWYFIGMADLEELEAHIDKLKIQS